MATISGVAQVEGLPEGVERVPKGKMPPAPLRIRLNTSTLLRRGVPTSFAVARAERKARRRWREDGAARAHAIETMRAIVTGTPREGDLETLAERHLVEAEVWEALFWQPWRPPSITGRSRERLMQASSSGRGLILSGAHLGPFFAVNLGVVTTGIDPHIVMGNWYYEVPSHDLWGRRSARWRIGLPSSPVVRPRGSYAILADLLRRGLVTTIYFDLPGPRETMFLGKPTMLVDGTARLACETGALVLPQRARRHGKAVEVEYFEALDPADFTGPDELHEALARVHERLVLEDPAALQDPAKTGWEDCARPDRWNRPPRPDREGGASV